MFAGDIASIALGDVVQNLVANKKTGTLTVRSGDLECHVQFKDGEIISYKDSRDINIARWLVDKEFVARNRMEEALRKYRKAKKKSLGAILRDKRAIDFDEYTGHLNKLVSDGICEVLSLKEGSFEFREGNLSEKLANREVCAMGLKYSAQNLIMEAARRSDDWQHIRRHLPSENEIYYTPRGNLEHLIQNADDEITARAVELLDGSLSLRQVISKLPCSRFEASRALADLIAKQKVRQIDSDQAVQNSNSDEDPKVTIYRLKTILDREPSNKRLHDKLASVYEAAAAPGEAAKHNKILAICYLDEGNLQDAKKHLVKSIDLNPKDILTWQKLWSCVRDIGDQEETLAFGQKYLEQFKQMGLMEMVRDHVHQLLRLFPERIDFKMELADAYFDLGDHKIAVQGLLELGQELLRDKEGFEDAEKVFSQVLKYDRKNEKARRICKELESGKLERRNAARKKHLHTTSLVCFVILGTWFICRELRVQNEIFSVVRSVLAEPILERQDYEEVTERLQEVLEKYPLSPTAAGQGEALIRSLDDKLEMSGFGDRDRRRRR